MKNQENPQIDLSISIVSFNTKSLLEQCLYSIFSNTKNLKFEVLLVDNASKDETVEMVKVKFPQVRFTQNPKNLIFTKAHNQNLAKVKGRYFLVLNEDTQIPAGALIEMVEFMSVGPKNLGLASCREVDEKGNLDMTCSRLPHPIFDFFEASNDLEIYGSPTYSGYQNRNFCHRLKPLFDNSSTP